jgi:hypothetical protein
MRASDPSSSLFQSPRLCPSQGTERISPPFWSGARVSRTTSYPSAASLCRRKVPMKPVPPARTMRPVVRGFPPYSPGFPPADKRRLKQQFLISELYLSHKLDLARDHHAFDSARSLMPGENYLQRNSHDQKRRRDLQSQTKRRFEENHWIVAKGQSRATARKSRRDD